MRIVVLLIALLFPCWLSAQKMDTVINNNSKGEMETFYLSLLPEKPSKGLLIVLGGFSYPMQTLQETDLPKKACAAGYTVVLPFLYHADSVDRNHVFQTRLEKLVPELIKKYHIPENKFVIGGQSWAGHQAMLYAEKAFTPGYHPIVKPNMVFAVDPPLDLKRLYNGYRRAIEIDPTKKKGSEASMITQLFERIFGGTPEQQPKAYEAASSFYRDAKDGGNARYLASIPVRLYSDPDINWFITQRNTPVEWTNLSDISACIVQLRLLGNTRAEYVSCLGKGFQPDGSRHPHAFSMLDAEEFVLWMEKNLK